MCKIINEFTGIAVPNLKGSIKILTARLKAEILYEPMYVLKAETLLFRSDSNAFQLTEKYGLEEVGINIINITENKYYNSNLQ